MDLFTNGRQALHQLARDRDLYHPGIRGARRATFQKLATAVTLMVKTKRQEFLTLRFTKQFLERITVRPPSSQKEPSVLSLQERFKTKGGFSSLTYDELSDVVSQLQDLAPSRKFTAFSKSSTTPISILRSQTELLLKQTVQDHVAQQLVQDRPLILEATHLLIKEACYRAS